MNTGQTFPQRNTELWLYFKEEKKKTARFVGALVKTKKLTSLSAISYSCSVDQTYQGLETKQVLHIILLTSRKVRYNRLVLLPVTMSKCERWKEEEPSPSFLVQWLSTFEGDPFFPPYHTQNILAQALKIQRFGGCSMMTWDSWGILRPPHLKQEVAGKRQKSLPKPY